MADQTQIVYEDAGSGVVIIRLNNPQNRNALSLPMRRELVLALDEAASDPSIRVLVVAGAGGHFCAGGDVKSMGDYTAQQARDRMKLGHQSLLRIRNAEMPVIAMTRGYAVGAGMNLALACDLVLAAESTVFMQSFVKVGLIPDAGGMYLLPRLIGAHRAKELMFTGRRIGAEEARLLGIVNAVYAEDRLEEETLALAQTLADGPAYAMGLMKKIINDTMDLSFPAALELEAAGQAICFGSKENLEGIRAFLEKRKPKFHE